MTTAQTAQATETQQAAPAAPASVGINWKSVGKTVSLFVGGAIVGAAGKLAWDHFVG